MLNMRLDKMILLNPNTFTSTVVGYIYSEVELLQKIKYSLYARWMTLKILIPHLKKTVRDMTLTVWYDFKS